MKIIISGFEPFGQHLTNPSQQILAELPKTFRDHQISTVTLPVTYEESFNELKKLIEIIKPDMVISLGLAHDRQTIDLERIAINMEHSESPDNNQVVRLHQTIDQNGSDGYFSTLPVKEWFQYAKKNQWPISISNSAGTYVCNSLMYKVLSLAKTEGFQAGFIHVPPTISPKTVTSFLLELIAQT